MSRSKQVVAILVSGIVGLLAAGLLPVYPQLGETRAQMEEGGDRISYDWELESLSGFVDNWRYIRNEEHTALNVGLVLVLSVLVAAGFAMATWLLWRRVTKA